MFLNFNEKCAKISKISSWLWVDLVTGAIGHAFSSNSHGRLHFVTFEGVALQLNMKARKSSSVLVSF